MKIKVIAKRTDSGFYSTTVSNSLKNLQNFVGGHIEAVTIRDHHLGNYVIICNDEGKINSCKYNCTLYGEPFFGDILIAGLQGEEFSDVPFSLNDFNNWVANR